MPPSILPWSVLCAAAMMLLVVCEREIQWSMVENVRNSSLIVSNLRVAKLNRTSAALRGNVIISADIGNDYLLSTEFFHSPMRNNHFSKSPFRLPLLGLCDFQGVFLSEYRPFLEHNFENFPLTVECPLGARTIVFNDPTFDTDSVPEYIRAGLWKGVVKLLHALTLTNVFELHLYSNVYDDN